MSGPTRPAHAFPARHLTAGAACITSTTPTTLTPRQGNPHMHEYALLPATWINSLPSLQCIPSIPSASPRVTFSLKRKVLANRCACLCARHHKEAL